VHPDPRMSRSVTLGCDGRRPKALTRSEIMSRIKGRDTSPELILRRLLFGNGWRYRVNFRTLAGKVDIAFPGMKVAVQIDGCFWHGCPWHGVMPRNNRSFWKATRSETGEATALCRLEAASRLGACNRVGSERCCLKGGEDALLICGTEAGNPGQGASLARRLMASPGANVGGVQGSP
jgi:DNA mismatch endonuclease Vsr